MATEAGIQDPRFLNIDKVFEHRFPEELHKIGFSITLLHNHSHAPKDSCLVYSEDFQEGIYRLRGELKSYYPCSWFLERNQELTPYEFSSKKIEFDQPQIVEQLEVLAKMGYGNYGVTVRPIECNVEVETQKGHKYYKNEAFKVREGFTFSETATNGMMMDTCYAYSACVITSTYAHVTDYSHKFF